MKYRYLGSSGLLVSRVCLGTMTYGMKDWGCDREIAARITRRFIEAGGNFFDTADCYSNGLSEKILGEALREHTRDDIVLATKCYSRMRGTPNARGLSRKHVIEACHASLKRLGTDYIDLYQLHGPDPYTPLEETMRSLDDLVRNGLVRYIGCSNLFAWQFVKANGISARLNLHRFCSGQYMYNVIQRDIEREILPACADEGMGLICWSPLASGFLAGKYRRGERPEEGSRIAYRANIDMPRYWHEDGFKIADEIVAVAKQRGKTPAQVALAWLLHDARVTAVIIGARTVEQLQDNVVVGDWELPPEEHRRLRDLVPFRHGYPREWIDPVQQGMFDDAEFPPPR